MDKKRQLARDTGLYALDVFRMLLGYEVSRNTRYPGPLTLLHISLANSGLNTDDKKQALEAMSYLLNKSLRISDIPTQVQDEFLVFLPATDEEGGRMVAERLLSHFRTTQSLSTGRLSKKNAYIGMTSHENGATVSIEQLMAEASVAMNEARLHQSYTCISFSEIPDLPQP